MEYKNGSFGGQSFKIPMSHSGPSLSITRGIPNIQKTVLTPGSYDTKGFSNPKEVHARASEKFAQKYPDAPVEHIRDMADIALETHLGEIKRARRNKKSFAFMEVALPAGTQWSDIKIFIDRFQQDNPLRSRVHILLKGKVIKITNFHEIGLEDTQQGRISVSGKILYLMSLGSRFAWDEKGNTPLKQRKEKERMSAHFQELFGMNTDPFIQENKEYKLQIELSTREKITLQKRYPKFTQRVVFDLLNDVKMFS